MLIPTEMGYGGQRGSKMVVAIYDYSPRHMSPNPNAALEELSFRKGQVIKVGQIHFGTIKIAMLGVTHLILVVMCVCSSARPHSDFRLSGKKTRTDFIGVN